MLRCVKIALVSVSALLALHNPLMASERYGQRPVVEISPDLSAPWVLQLRQGPGLPREAGVPTGLPGVSVHAAPQISTQRNFGIVLAEPKIRNLPEPIVQQAALSVPQGVNQPQEREINPEFLPQQVAYDGNEKPGTIVISTSDKFLYLVEGNGTARRYGVGVGKEGFLWQGRQKITRKTEWPSWRPPAEMKIRVRLKEGRILPDHMEGGPENPLGARALYLGSTLYRIHGTNQPWTIGTNVSSGCIRMRNEDVVDLYERVGVGTLVIVR